VLLCEPLPPSTSIAVMDALAPGWRSAPWWSGSTLTPYSDAAARRPGQRGIPLFGWLLQSWLSLSTAYAALMTDSPPGAVLTEARRWAPQVSEKTMLDLRDALLEAAPHVMGVTAARCLETHAVRTFQRTLLFACPDPPRAVQRTPCRMPSSPSTPGCGAASAGGGAGVDLGVHYLGSSFFCPVRPLFLRWTSAETQRLFPFQRQQRRLEQVPPQPAKAQPMQAQQRSSPPSSRFRCDPAQRALQRTASR